VIVDLTRTRRVHLVGVGGAGMSGIARMLLQRGHEVSGTDLHGGRALEQLRVMGARVEVGHDADHLGDAEFVVVSTAVPADNPELRSARSRDLPVLRRAEMLAALMDGSRSVLVAGSHGKTTTTSMTVVALHAAGLDPSYAIGGALNETGTNAHAGTDELFVAEADESDRSFLVFEPSAVIITNVEFDHPDEFGSHEDVAAAFMAFAARRRSGAPAIVCLDDPGAADLVERLADPVITYGQDPRAELRLVVSDDGRARISRDDDQLIGFRVGAPGRHNLLNAVAALAVCEWAGVDLGAAAAGLERFTGAQRRFQRLGTARGIEVVDDYAHHPTELRATLEAARSATDGRIVLVVQPHRYSRTRVLGEELGRAAAAAEVVVVTEVYASNEAPIPGVTGELVAEAARKAGAKVVWQPHLGSVVDELVEVVQQGDLVLVTGAGDVTQVGPALLEALRRG